MLLLHCRNPTLLHKDWAQVIGNEVIHLSAGNSLGLSVLICKMGVVSPVSPPSQSCGAVQDRRSDLAEKSRRCLTTAMETWIPHEESVLPSASAQGALVQKATWVSEGERERGGVGDWEGQRPTQAPPENTVVGEEAEQTRPTGWNGNPKPGASERMKRSSWASTPGGKPGRQPGWSLT